MRLISELAKELGRNERRLKSMPSTIFKATTLAFATLSFTLAQAQTGPAGLTFFGLNVVRESVNSSAPIFQLAVGDEHAIGIRADGTVVTWGYDKFGQCDVPSGIANAVQAAAGSNHSLVLLSDGSISSFGDKSYHQLAPPPAFRKLAKLRRVTFFRLR